MLLGSCSCISIVRYGRFSIFAVGSLEPAVVEVRRLDIRLLPPFAFCFSLLDT